MAEETEAVRQARMRGSIAGAQSAVASLMGQRDRLARKVVELRFEIIGLEQQRQALTEGRVPLPVPDGYSAPAVVAPILCDQLLPAEVIYALVDPIDPALVRYVGRAADPIGRYRGHCTRGTDVIRDWIDGLQHRKRTPLMLLVERCEASLSAAREAHWIHHYRDRLQADLNRSIPRRTAEGVTS